MTSTSDNDWMAWQPDNLLAEFDSPKTDALPAAAVDASSDVQLQAELSRLRQKAEQQGFAQGQAKGLEEGKKHGYEEGLRLGKEEGIELSKLELNQVHQQHAERFTQLVESFQTSLGSLDSVIPSRLVQMALTAARSVLGEYIVCDNAQRMLRERIQRLLQEEPLFTGPVRLWVSAEDRPLIEESMGEAFAANGWELRVDEKMLPGGCRVVGCEGELDASVETRWQELCCLSREDFQL